MLKKIKKGYWIILGILAFVFSIIMFCNKDAGAGFILLIMAFALVGRALPQDNKEMKEIRDMISNIDWDGMRNTANLVGTTIKDTTRQASDTIKKGAERVSTGILEKAGDIDVEEAKSRIGGFVQDVKEKLNEKKKK